MILIGLLDTILPYNNNNESNGPGYFGALVTEAQTVLA